MPENDVTKVFRAIHLPRRRRDVVSEQDSTPINAQPGEMLYDAEQNKLYAALEDGSAVEISGGSGGALPPTVVYSNTTGISGAVQITNIVAISQAAYDALVTKDAATLYIING